MGVSHLFTFSLFHPFTLKEPFHLYNMQYRQKDRKQYFNELSETSKKFFLPYIERFLPIEKGMNVLEIGCGDGGNLLPIAERGCNVVGVDMAECRINDAKRFFEAQGTEGTFIAPDVFAIKEFEHHFDLIICHDVIEHIMDKALFLHKVRKFLRPQGIIFMSFPAWQMPFGGHQQICRSKLLSHLPWFHLLPAGIYGRILRAFGENAGITAELLEIKQTRCPIELFERLANEHFTIRNRTLFFINPHYETKFGLRPRLLWSSVGRVRHVRNFFTTSCFYILE